MRIHQQMGKVADLRRRIREAGESTSDRELQLLWMDAQDELNEVTLFGDLVLAAFFEGDKPKKREAKRAEFANVVASGDADCYRGWLAERRDEDPPLAPFHWELEFPEVFEREPPGFDAIVGNPPFGGHVTVVNANIRGYTDWLRLVHVTSTGKCDVVAHFFRRAFDLVHPGGAFGLIATNTIAQGDTRTSGLRWICENGGDIYHARRRVKWPGLAAVVVSVLHVSKGRFIDAKLLDDKETDRITAFLFHRGGHDDPARLKANAGKSFVGSAILGMGFTFDDTDKKGVATPLAEMQRLIHENPRNREVVFPFIGGEEVNTNPIHAHHRYVINFRDYPLQRGDVGESWSDAGDDRRVLLRREPIVPLDYPEPVAEDWPDLLTVVEDKVKPERLRSSENSKSSHGRRARVWWWQLYHQARELRTAIANLERVLANSQVSQRVQFAFLPVEMVYAHTLNVFPFDTYAAFCVSNLTLTRFGRTFSDRQ